LLNKVPAARICALLAFFGGQLNIYLIFTLFYFLPPAMRGISNSISLWSFAGNALGVLLCPLFLAFPGQTKPKKTWVSAAVIAAVILLNLGIRSLGVERWLASPVLRALLAVTTGIFYPITFGLFFQAWRFTAYDTAPAGDSRRTNRWCALLLAASMMGAMATRFFGVPLLSRLGLAADPSRAAALMFSVVTVAAAAMGLFSILVALLADGDFSESAAETVTPPNASTTDWFLIFKLFILNSTFAVLNTFMERRLWPLLSLREGAYHYHVPAAIAAILLLCLLTGIMGERRFFRLFLPPVIALFIMLPCMPLIQNQRLLLALSTLVVASMFTMRAVCDTAVMEYFSGGFWYFGAATIIRNASLFNFVGNIVSRSVTMRVETMVIASAAAAVIITFVAFRILFPKTAPLNKTEDRAAHIKDMFRRHKLSPREMEVAHLMVAKNMSNSMIADSIFRSKATVEKHVGNIYRKFKVKNRAEFLSKLFVHGEGEVDEG
jgi:DNA-binding CsgD family transcriptional regulator/MFS family permease